jgi:hypothetical protein
MAAFQYLATMPGYTSPSFAPSADMIEMKNNLLTDAEINTPIHPPLKEHRQTFIILHGRGSSTEEIAPALLSSTTSKNEALQSAFPHAKIIFPTATRSQPYIFKEVRIESFSSLLIYQWFGNWFLQNYLSEREKLSVPGLYACCSYMHKLLKREIQPIGKVSIVPWGSRQGAVPALSTLFTWDGEPFTALVGMSEWLPYSNWLWDFTHGDDSDLHRNPLYDPDSYCRRSMKTTQISTCQQRQ